MREKGKRNLRGHGFFLDSFTARAVVSQLGRGRSRYPTDLDEGNYMLTR